MANRQSSIAATYLPLAVVLLLALGLRLVVWRWRVFYPLGGDEQEYLNQALTLLQERRYVELRLMRPPLYGVFLAGSILLVDSLVQHLRLIQAIISTLTLVPVWLLTREMGHWYAPDNPSVGRRAALVAALLCALSYTLALNASELLTETLFLFGLTTLFWLLLDAARRRGRGRLISAGLAGVLLGLLCLTRAVALPLLPLGLLWLLLARPPQSERSKPLFYAGMLFSLATMLVIMPWTARNYVTYGGLILIDTTGAENLWLDNDPAGREAVKAQLYLLQEDRLARQQLAAERGLAVVLDQPGRFAYKAWGELQSFFALEYVDDLRDRRAIWLPPSEVWARLVLGDALWLVLVLVGSFGLVRGQRSPGAAGWSLTGGWPTIHDPRWLCVPWALYVLLTALIFHVELRYRLPLYPVLLPYAAWVIAGLQWRVPDRSLFVRQGLAWLAVLAIVALMLLHRPYARLAWELGWKHLRLAQAEAALEQNDPLAARWAASAALAHDPTSALARVALARAAMQTGDLVQAEEILQAAVEVEPFHPQAHMLLGDLWRQQGHATLSLNALQFETASLQDLQQWAWHWFISPPESKLDIGGGLDLGFVQGFYAPEAGGFRWTTAQAQMRLARPGGLARLHMRLAAGQPEGAPLPMVAVYADDRWLGRFAVTSGWREYILLLPPPAEEADQEVVIELRSDTFTPRAYDPASSDGRTLGVMVDQATIITTEAHRADR